MVEQLDEGICIWQVLRQAVMGTGSKLNAARMATYSGMDMMRVMVRGGCHCASVLEDDFMGTVFKNE